MRGHPAEIDPLVSHHTVGLIRRRDRIARARHSLVECRRRSAVVREYAVLDEHVKPRRLGTSSIFADRKSYRRKRLLLFLKRRKLRKQHR